ncbi:hypothetical protein BGX38DRAFT_1180932, partial [Terfezia claveryi]
MAVVSGVWTSVLAILYWRGVLRLSKRGRGKDTKVRDATRSVLWAKVAMQSLRAWRLDALSVVISGRAGKGVAGEEWVISVSIYFLGLEGRAFRQLV